MATKRRRKKRSKGPGLVATLRDPDKIRVAYIIAGFALIFGGSLGFGASQCGTRKAPPGEFDISPDDPIAIIMDHEITYGEFGKNYQRMQAGAAARYGRIIPPLEFWAGIKYMALMQMIDLEYMIIMAEQDDVVVNEEEVDQKIEEIRTSLLRSTEDTGERSIFERIGDLFSGVKEEKAFAMALKDIDPTLTVSGLRDIFTREILADEWFTQYQGEIGQAEMDRLKSQANAIRAEIEDVSDFAQAASDYSDHTDSSAAGGLIPLVKKGSTDLPELVIEHALVTAVTAEGEISNPISVFTEEHRGVWLVTVISQKLATGDEWDNARPELYQQLLQEKREAVESEEIELEEGQNLEVDDQVVIDAYQEATIRVIYLAAGDPVELATIALKEDQEDIELEIFDSEIRSMHHALNGNWALAAADYAIALQRIADRLAEDPEELQYVMDPAQARIRYLIGILWATPIAEIANEYEMALYDELPQEVREEMHSYFVLAQLNFNKAIELENMDPWYLYHRTQIDIARQLLSTRVIDDLAIAHEFSSGDPYLENSILGTLNQAIALDDKALEAAGGERPEAWTDPIFPEDEYNLTVEETDMPFIELIEEAQQTMMLVGGIDDEALQGSGVEDDLGSLSISDVEQVIDELSIDDVTEQTAQDSETASEQGEDGEGIESEPGIHPNLPDYLPLIPPPDPNGPFTEELRTRLDELHSKVQAVVDAINAARMAEQQQQYDIPPEVLEELQLDMEAESQLPPEEGENLLEEGDEQSE